MEGLYPVSWKRYLLPEIHPEGLKIVIFVLLIIIAAGFLGNLFFGRCAGMTLMIIGLPLVIFAYYFFRNPDRVTPDDPNAVIAPADGLVSGIIKMKPPKTLGLGEEDRIRVSIFMSVFSVHINRAPVSGTVCSLTYHHGKFVNAADKDSDENERQEIGIEREDGTKIGVIQIAGLVARRIYCPLKMGEKVEAGKVFGLIRFGSRLDVYLPPGTVPSVRLGQTSVAGETIIARLSENSGPKQ